MADPRKIGPSEFDQLRNQLGVTSENFNQYFQRRGGDIYFLGYGNNRPIGSGETAKKTISGYYQAYFGREPSAAEFNIWYNKGTRELERALINNDQNIYGKGKGSIDTQVNPNGTVTTSFSGKPVYPSGNTGSASSLPSKTEWTYSEWINLPENATRQRLPQRDAMGRFRWVNQDGSVTEQDGFSLEGGQSGWEYLDTRGSMSNDEFVSATALYNTNPPPKEWGIMTDLEKKEYLDQAHREIDTSFLRAVAQGQTQTIETLGTTLEQYKKTMESEDLQMQQDISNTVAAMEKSGLSFSGKSKLELGDFYSAAGVLSPEDRAKILDNIAQIQQIRGGEVTKGQTVTQLQMPKPIGQNGQPVNFDEPNPTTGKQWTEPEKDKVWNDFYATDTWKGYQEKVSAIAGTATDVLSAEAGGGVYGLGDQLDRFAGTRAFSGLVPKANQQIQESSRSNFNRNISTIGRAAENTLGSANLNNLSFPTIGGRQIFRPGQNVLGSGQGGFQTDISTRAGGLSGSNANQYTYRFPL